MKVSNLVVFELMEFCDFQIFYCLYQSIKQEKRLVFFVSSPLDILGPGNHGWWLEASFLTCTFFYFFCNRIGTKKHFHFTMGNTLLKHLKHNNSFLGASSRFCKCWTIFVVLFSLGTSQLECLQDTIFQNLMTFRNVLSLEVSFKVFFVTL